MQELVKDQSPTQNDDDRNEQGRQRQQTSHGAFVPMSMSSGMNASVRDALVILGGETTQPATCESQQYDANGAEQYSSQIRSSSKAECKMRGRHSKRSALADDKNKRSRTTFNAAQINALEKIFEEQQYPDQPLREKIADRLDMEEQKVVIWFQNRRAKFKRNKRPDNVNRHEYARPTVQDAHRLGGLQTIGRQSAIGGNFKRDSRHVNANGTYSAVQQFQNRRLHSPYHFDKPAQIMHGTVGSVGSTSQEQSGNVNNVKSNGFGLAMDGFASSPEPVTSSVDIADVSTSLKQDKPLIKEPPPNQICTNAGCQDEMRQALLQWRTRQSMPSQQPIHSPVLDLRSNSSPNDVPAESTSTHMNGQSQPHGSVYDEYVNSSTSSSSCSEDEHHRENTEFTHKNQPTEHHQVPSSNFQCRAFGKPPVLNQPNQLYLDIPSVSSGDVSSPAPHSTTSTASWPSTSDLSSIDPTSPGGHYDHQPLSEISRFNNIAPPTGVNWSNTYNEAPIKQTYMPIPHVTNSYVDDLPPLRRHDELPTQQRCRRRFKMRRIRHEERRRYPNKMNRNNNDRYLPYPHNIETNIRQEEHWESTEDMTQERQGGAFTSDDFTSCQRQTNTRPQCKYAQPISAYHTEHQQERHEHQRHPKRRHYYNNRLQHPENPEYSQMANQNMMVATTEELRSAVRQQDTDRNGNLNGFRYNELCSSSSRNAPKNMNFHDSNSFHHAKSQDQQRNGVVYPHATPEWNNPIMEVRVPIPSRRPKHPQPHREQNRATSGVVHHYGDADELAIPPLPVVESVSDLSQSLNADQSATLNRVLESVVKDIFPFSDNFISI